MVSLNFSVTQIGTSLKVFPELYFVKYFTSVRKTLVAVLIALLMFLVKTVVALKHQFGFLIL